MGRRDKKRNTATIAAKVADLKDARLTGADVKVDPRENDTIAPHRHARNHRGRPRPPNLTQNYCASAPLRKARGDRRRGEQADSEIHSTAVSSVTVIHAPQEYVAINSAKLSWRAQTVSADVETRRNESGPDAGSGGRNRLITTLQRGPWSWEKKKRHLCYFTPTPRVAKKKGPF